MKAYGMRIDTDPIILNLSTRWCGMVGQLHAPIPPLNVGGKNPIVTALYSTKKQGC
jgi:hypothetical protein